VTTTETPLATELELAASKPRQTLKQLIERQAPAIGELLKPVGMDVDAFKRTLFVELRRNPMLDACDPLSVLGAGMLCAQVRLTPGPLGHVYLVPFKRGDLLECTFVLGYTGIVELARRSGVLGGLKAEIVWDCDEYDYRETENGPKLSYKPGPEAERTERRLVWVRWKERVGGAWVSSVLEVPKSRIERAKAASAAARKKAGPWFSDEDTMWRKTGIRAARPLLPLTTEFASAVSYDDQPVLYDEDAEGLAPPAEADGE